MICSRCLIDKEEAEFPTRDGKVKTICKECVKAYKQVYAVENKDRIYAQRKAYRESHKDELKVQKAHYWTSHKERGTPKHRAYYVENKDAICAQCKEYREAHREEKALRDAKYAKDNWDRICKRKREWTIAHKKQVSENSREYTKKRRKTDIQFKLTCNLRTRLRSALCRNARCKSTLRLVGCSVEELRIWIENKFQEGMTWDNWGVFGWHIDHIIPCASFDLSLPENQIKCFHYTNLQPLWAKDNMSKHDRLDWVLPT
jgi:hypothetical protein